MNYRDLSFYVLLVLALVWDCAFWALSFFDQMPLELAFFSSLLVTAIPVAYCEWLCFVEKETK